jgi:hypothetical protein
MTCSSLGAARYGGIWGDMGEAAAGGGKNLGGSPLLRYNKTIYILLYTTIYYYILLLYITIYNYIISSSALSKD